MALIETTPEEMKPSSAPGSEKVTEPKTKIDVTLQGVAETLFISLAARAFDASTEQPMLGDQYAIDVLDKLNYDYDETTLPPAQCTIMMLRTRWFDRCTSSFIATNPRCTVLHLACGLDSRMQRLDWDSSVRWVDVDLPEVIALRKQVLSQSLPGRDYRPVGANVVDDAWLEDVPADRPTVVVMEGLLSYLTKDEAEGLLMRLAERFQGELLFECINKETLTTLRKGALKAASRTGAEFCWSIENPQDLQNLHPRLEMLESISVPEAPGVEDLPLVTRAAMYAMSWIPSIRNRARFVRFRICPRISA